MKHQSTIKMTALSAALLVGAAHSASANNLEDNRVLRDGHGNAVYSAVSKTCVRTNWETKNDVNPCAKHVAVTAPSPARALLKKDKAVTFAFDSARLDMNAKRQLDNLAGTLRKSADVRDVNIVGFADKIGGNQYNENLSQKRAAAVKNYLAQQGYVNTNLVDTRGLGESQSITNCGSQSSHAELIDCLRPDRRVEVEIKFTDTINTAYNQPKPY